ncbi:hypothetical protein BDAP_001554 [Binucleata daphniae]
MNTTSYACVCLLLSFVNEAKEKYQITDNDDKPVDIYGINNDKQDERYKTNIKSKTVSDHISCNIASSDVKIIKNDAQKRKKTKKEIKKSITKACNEKTKQLNYKFNTQKNKDEIKECAKKMNMISSHFEKHYETCITNKNCVVELLNDNNDEIYVSQNHKYNYRLEFAMKAAENDSTKIVNNDGVKQEEISDESVYYSTSSDSSMTSSGSQQSSRSNDPDDGKCNAANAAVAATEPKKTEKWYKKVLYVPFRFAGYMLGIKSSKKTDETDNTQESKNDKEDKKSVKIQSDPAVTIIEDDSAKKVTQNEIGTKKIGQESKATTTTVKRNNTVKSATKPEKISQKLIATTPTVIKNNAVKSVTDPNNVDQKSAAKTPTVIKNNLVKSVTKSKDVTDIIPIIPEDDKNIVENKLSYLQNIINGGVKALKYIGLGGLVDIASAVPKYASKVKNYFFNNTSGQNLVTVCSYLTYNNDDYIETNQHKKITLSKIEKNDKKFTLFLSNLTVTEFDNFPADVIQRLKKLRKFYEQTAIQKICDTSKVKVERLCYIKNIPVITKDSDFADKDYIRNVDNSDILYGYIYYDNKSLNFTNLQDGAHYPIYFDEHTGYHIYYNTNQKYSLNVKSKLINNAIEQSILSQIESDVDGNIIATKACSNIIAIKACATIVSQYVPNAIKPIAQSNHKIGNTETTSNPETTKPGIAANHTQNSVKQKISASEKTLLRGINNETYNPVVLLSNLKTNDPKSTKSGHTDKSTADNTNDDLTNGRKQNLIAHNEEIESDITLADKEDTTQNEKDDDKKADDKSDNADDKSENTDDKSDNDKNADDKSKNNNENTGDSANDKNKTTDKKYTKIILISSLGLAAVGGCAGVYYFYFYAAKI